MYHRVVLQSPIRPALVLVATYRVAAPVETFMNPENVMEVRIQGQTLVMCSDGWRGRGPVEPQLSVRCQEISAGWDKILGLVGHVSEYSISTIRCVRRRTENLVSKFVSSVRVLADDEPQTR